MSLFSSASTSEQNHKQSYFVAVISSHEPIKLPLVIKRTGSSNPISAMLSASHFTFCFDNTNSKTSQKPLEFSQLPLEYAPRYEVKSRFSPRRSTRRTSKICKLIQRESVSKGVPLRVVPMVSARKEGNGSDQHRQQPKSTSGDTRCREYCIQFNCIIWSMLLISGGKHSKNRHHGNEAHDVSSTSHHGGLPKLPGSFARALASGRRIIPTGSSIIVPRQTK